MRDGPPAGLSVLVVCIRRKPRVGGIPVSPAESGASFPSGTLGPFLHGEAQGTPASGSTAPHPQPRELVPL